ncbi:hypothetical protein YB2330_001306 [Saitoella coloradoensis]
MTAAEENEDQDRPSTSTGATSPDDYELRPMATGDREGGGGGATDKPSIDPLVVKSNSIDLESQPSTPVTPPHPYSTFSKRKINFIIFMAALAGLFSPLSANIYFPAISQLATHFHTTPTRINLSITTYMLSQAISPTLYGSLTDTLGRRPVYVLTFLVYIPANIALAVQDSYAALLVLRALQAAGAASVIAVGAGMVGDVVPRERRGGAMGWFNVGPMLGPCIGPVIGGALADKYGWRAIFWFLAICGGVFLAFLVGWLPETLRAIVGDGSVEARGVNASLWELARRRRRRRKSGLERVHSRGGGERPKFRFPNPIAPLAILKEKDVACALLFSGVFYGVWYMVTASTSVIFEDKYGLNETEVGLTFLANGMGCLVGSILQGRILDWDYRITKARWAREGGHHDNETEGEDSFPIERARLRSLWWLCLCFGGGCIAYGWTIEKRVHISAPLIFQFIIGYSATSIFNTFGTLVVDLFPGRGSSATAANNFVRCALGAVGTAVVDEMLGSRVGAGWGFVLLIGVCACCSPLVWVVLRFGPGWRGERVRREREKACAKAAAAGGK